MACSSAAEVNVTEKVEENSSKLTDAEEKAAASGDEQPENGERTTNKMDEGEPFKKPGAFFAVPPRSHKRPSGSGPSKPSAEAAKSENKGENVDPGGVPEVTAKNIVSEKRREDPQVDGRVKSEPTKDQSRAPRAPVTKQAARQAPPKLPPLPYTEPPWGGTRSEESYALETLKNGAIVDTMPLTERSFFVVGRLPGCDLSLEHPSISRFHAVLQYRGEAGDGGGVGEQRGFYIHDLGSTHGTVVNKNKIPPKTYVRLHVGHVIKFGGSTRLFVLQGPEFDEEEESELTVTELKERARQQKADLEKRMMGEFSDGEEEEEGAGEGGEHSGKEKENAKKEELGCTWGMEEEAAPEEDENEENPFSTEFQEDQEAAYLKDPKKALQGFFDREGEELEFEYEDKSHGSWLCRIKLPVDDAQGRQLVAEVTHTGKKKEAAVQCCLEACRMLEARGLLRQEAVSRKRKKKNWEDEDYYDSDDDTFLDRTGTVERKRQERMRKAGKVEERTETYESLVAKLAAVEKELSETQSRLNAGKKGGSSSSAEDSLDAFMTAVRSEAATDAVARRKLHVQVADLRKEAQRLRRLVELTRPAQLPALLPSGSSEKPKKALPLFGAMKGGRKFKLKTGTIGTLPPKRPNLPAELFNMKELPPGGEEEEEEEEEDEKMEETSQHEENGGKAEAEESRESTCKKMEPQRPRGEGKKKTCSEVKHTSEESEDPAEHTGRSTASPQTESKAEGETKPSAEAGARKKRVMGPSRPPVQLSAQYPEDDPDYSVWMPPTGQTGDGRTHLNDKYGY